jgi:two-component system, NarL family, response regulator NreC
LLRRKQACVLHSILIVDDNDLIRRMLRSWLEQHSEWHICGEAENGKRAVERVEELEAAREIGRLAPATATIIFTVHTSDQLLNEARAHGVRDVVSKCDMLGDHLLSALRKACA